MAKSKTHTTKGLRPPKHHSSAHAVKVYWPYLPLFVLLLGGMFLNVWQPLQSNRPATLAYATEISRGNLLASTNSQRSSSGQASLTLNSKLNAAAQAKANDMVARNYWSHNTPDGDEPWVFINAQGYSYDKAGENLAYGFSTSNATIIGWMNSPSHKANMLDTSFSEVGFGFANSEDFINTGNETIVVAMYGKPTYVAPPAPAPAPTPAPQTTTSKPQTKNAQTTTTVPTPTPAPAETPTPAPTAETETPVEIKDDTVVKYDEPVTTDTKVPSTADEKSSRITILQQFTKGKYAPATVIVSLAGFTLAILWLVKHFVAVRKYFIEGEYFVAHHPVLDLIVVSIVASAVYLTQSSGVVL